MTEFVEIDPEHNVEAVRRRLARTREPYVAFIVPEGWQELDNIVRLRLLQRQAQIQRRRVALVTRQIGTRKAAQAVGIPLYLRQEDVPSNGWRMPNMEPLLDPRQPDATLPDPPPWRRADIVARTARPSLHQARQRRIRTEETRRRPLPFWLHLVGYSAMGGLVIVLLVFFGLYVLPAATITVVPGTEVLTIETPLLADANLDVADLEERRLPARLIETTIEETGISLTTGSQQKPIEHASGTVVFNNLGTTTVEIPRDTIVGTSTGTPVNFRTVAPATLEGGVGSRVTVPIEAVEPGIQGNVRANTINTVNGALRFRARVINTGGTFGGGSQLVPVVTQQDKDALLAQVQASGEAKAYDALLQELEPGEWLPRESVQTFVIAQAFDKFNDDEGEELKLNLRILVQGTALNEAETNDVMVDVLREDIPERGMLVADSVTVGRIPNVEAIGRQVQFTMTATAEYVIPIDPVDVRAAVVGLTPEQAIQTVGQRWLLREPPAIYRDPEWLATLPNFGSRIQVRVEYSGQEEGKGE